MGSGQSVSFGILLIAFLIMVSTVYSNYMFSYETIENSNDKRNTRFENKLKTIMEISSYSLATDNRSFSVLISNNGTKVWENPDKFDVLCNITLLDSSWNYTFDAWVPYRELNASIPTESIYWNYTITGENSINPDFIDPDETLNITIHARDKQLSGIRLWIKIITDNGVSDFAYINL
ncbi:MAG: hypothetical protein ACTSWY_06980 [Promethearchaeota archaeon]